MTRIKEHTCKAVRLVIQRGMQESLRDLKFWTCAAVDPLTQWGPWSKGPGQPGQGDAAAGKGQPAWRTHGARAKGKGAFAKSDSSSKGQPGQGQAAAGKGQPARQTRGAGNEGKGAFAKSDDSNLPFAVCIVPWCRFGPSRNSLAFFRV